MDDPYAELARVKARIAEMERYATAAPPLESAIADAMSPLKPVDPARRKLVNAAHGFVPDPQSEAAVAAREANPERFDRDFAAMKGSALELSLYTRGRAAAIKLGTFVPEEGTSNE
ncbi:MAG TPA: hypothetical protein VIK08_06185 [Candidatus Limnocylindrales bacterium]